MKKNQMKGFKVEISKPFYDQAMWLAKKYGFARRWKRKQKYLSVTVQDAIENEFMKVLKQERKK